MFVSCVPVFFCLCVLVYFWSNPRLFKNSNCFSRCNCCRICMADILVVLASSSCRFFHFKSTSLCTTLLCELLTLPPPPNMPLLTLAPPPTLAANPRNPPVGIGPAFRCTCASRPNVLEKSSVKTEILVCAELFKSFESEELPVELEKMLSSSWVS